MTATLTALLRHVAASLQHAAVFLRQQAELARQETRERIEREANR
jgi:hypothetical protein